MSKIIIAIIVIVIVAGLGYCVYQSTLAPEELTGIEQNCIDSGGQISTLLCCKSTGDFPNLCLIGVCGCSPDNSHQVKICDCGPDQCFNGSQCISSKLIHKDETAGWRTYRNEALKFASENIEFIAKYPYDWSYTIIGEYNPKVFFGPQEIIENLKSGESVDDKSLGVMISSHDKILYERGILPYRKSNEYLSITSFNIEMDGIQGIYYVSEHLVNRLGYEKGDKTVTVDLAIDDGYLSIHFFNYQNLDIFHKILSTFKFL